MQRRPVELHPEAVAEALAAREWYETRSQVAADAFMAEIEYGVEQISMGPAMWAAYLHGTRRYPFIAFPIRISTVNTNLQSRLSRLLTLDENLDIGEQDNAFAG